MSELTFHLLKISISVCIAVVTYYIVPLIKEKLNDVKYAQLLAAIKTAVDAAEQTIKEPGMGCIKKEHVLDWAKYWCLKHKIEITDVQLDHLIEHFVYELNQCKKA